jgi:hypothetical protein
MGYNGLQWAMGCNGRSAQWVVLGVAMGYNGLRSAMGYGAAIMGCWAVVAPRVSRKHRK